MDDDPVRAFVRHPERREYTLEELEELRLAVIETELSGADVFALGAVTGKDPFSRVRAILEHHRSGLYPRLSDLGWLAEGFQAWLDSEGQQSLEKCLELRGRGHTGNPFKESHRQRVGTSAIVQVHRLRILFGLKVQDAAAMVAALMEEHPELDEPRRHDLPPLSSETLEYRYRHAAWIRNESIDELVASRCTEETKRAFLYTFPRHSWEHLPELRLYR